MVGKYSSRNWENDIPSSSTAFGYGIGAEEGKRAGVVDGETVLSFSCDCKILFGREFGEIQHVYMPGRGSSVRRRPDARTIAMSRDEFEEDRGRYK